MLPSNITVEQAKTRIHDDVQNVQQSAQKLASESGCPEAAPEPQQKQESTPQKQDSMPQKQDSMSQKQESTPPFDGQ